MGIRQTTARLLAKYRRRFGALPKDKRPDFAKWVETERRPAHVGFRHARRTRTREARRHAQWVAFKAKHAGDGHRGAPRHLRERLRRVFASVPVPWAAKEQP